VTQVTGALEPREMAARRRSPAEAELHAGRERAGAYVVAVRVEPGAEAPIRREPGAAA
jgi:hypothetical protein